MRNGKPRKTKRIEVEMSCGNVFADLGLPDADKLLLHAELVQRLDDILAERKLTHAKAAVLLGVRRSDLIALLGGQLNRFPTDQLFRFLNALDQNVEIVIRPIRSTKESASTQVVAG